MRKVTANTAGAFIENREYREGNTYTDGETLYLHGNAIAWRLGNGQVVVTMAGYPTVTTRERLNGLLEKLGFPYTGISQREGIQYVVRFAQPAGRLDPSMVYRVGDLVNADLGRQALPPYIRPEYR